MDTPNFVKYIHSLKFPALPEAKEAELRADVTSMIDKYYKNGETMAENQKEYIIDVILNVTKFLSFFVSIAKNVGRSTYPWGKDLKL